MPSFSYVFNKYKHCVYIRVLQRKEKNHIEGLHENTHTHTHIFCDISIARIWCKTNWKTKNFQGLPFFQSKPMGVPTYQEDD